MIAPGGFPSHPLLAPIGPRLRSLSSEAMAGAG